MSKDSQTSQGLLVAVERGYTVASNGDALNPQGQVIRGCLNSNKYWYITIRMDTYYGYRKCVKVFKHRVMGYQKFGDRVFDDTLEIRHLNGDKDDNSFDNIDIGTPTQNHHDIPPEVRMQASMQAAAVHRKYTHDEVREMRTLNASGISYKNIMEVYGIPKSTLSDIINHRTYREVAD